ncbi:MAG TPA: hypothetical protein VJ487_18815 [Alphaproteobacteria bacterium]|nr:hypothetical protein [Alphaproteobacteria bacterium]
MSITDRVLDALKSAIQLETRVTSLASDVRDLAREVRDIDRRLVRIEAAIEFGTRGGFTAASPPGAPAIEGRRK